MILLLVEEETKVGLSFGCFFPVGFLALIIVSSSQFIL